MKSILELWYGNLDPTEADEHRTKEAREILSLLSRHKSSLKQIMNQQEAELFDRYCENAEENMQINSSLAFCNGFCLGLRLAAEAFVNSENLFE